MSSDWVRVGRKIRARRIELDIKTATALAAKAGLSGRILGDLERGSRDSYSRSTKMLIERALNWSEGDLDRIAEGAEPTPTSGAEVMSTSSDIAAIRALLERLVNQGQPDRVNTQGGVVPERMLSKAMTSGFDRMASPGPDPRAVAGAIREVAVPAADSGTAVAIYLDFIAGVDRIAVYGLSPIAYAKQTSTFVQVKHSATTASATFTIDPNRGWDEQVEAVIEWLAPVPS